MAQSIHSPEDAIDLWLVPLEGTREEEAWCRSVLSSEELSRADRFRFAEHTRRFLLRHGQLRKILAGYLHAQPGDIVFFEDEYGKPTLSPKTGIHFNISHSEEMSLIAVSDCWELGVDIERLRPVESLELMAGRYLCAAEQQWLGGLDGSSQDQAFLRLWTAKEALLKGIGLGLRLPADQVHLELSADGPVQVRALPGFPVEQWHVELFQPTPRYTAALAWNEYDWIMMAY